MSNKPGTFQKGTSGNLRGRPRKIHRPIDNATNLAIEAEVKPIVEAVVADFLEHLADMPKDVE